MILYTATELRERLTALDAAIMGGVKTVVIGDETIVYQDVGQMAIAREMFIDQLRQLEGAPRDRHSLAVFGGE